MYRRHTTTQAAPTPQGSLKDPDSLPALLAATAKRSFNTSLTYRIAAVLLVASAIVFDGLNPWAQAVNGALALVLVLCAIRSNSTAKVIERVAQREASLCKVNGYIGFTSARGIKNGSMSAQRELDEAWARIQYSRPIHARSLPEAVQILIAERDRAWAALEALQNEGVQARNKEEKPRLRVVSNNP